MPSPPDKSSLRRTLLAARAALSAQEQQALSAQACARLLALLPDAPCTVALYHPIRGECSPLPLAETLVRRGCTLALPAMAEKHAPLQFRRWQPGTTLAAGVHYGIPEPELSAEIINPDIIIVPLVGFDRVRHRLGYGGGYYDRTLAQLRAQNMALKAFGLAYALQEIPSTGALAHDMQLDAVVTENDIIR